MSLTTLSQTAPLKSKAEIDRPDSKWYASITIGGAMCTPRRISAQKRRGLCRWGCQSAARCVLRSVELLRFYCGRRVSLGNNACIDTRNRCVVLFSHTMGLSFRAWRGKMTNNLICFLYLNLFRKKLFLKGELHGA